MAATSSNLTTQLGSKLLDENVSLSSRLDVAFTVFCSSDIPIVQKEEYVLSWVLSNLSSTSESKDKELLYSFLYKCLQCQRFQNLHVNLKTSVVEDLFSVLKGLKVYSEDIKLLIRNCCEEIFKISFFQRWFMCDPENVCRVICSYFRSINSLASANQFCNVIDHFLHIHKMSLLKVELRTHFVKGVMKPMCEALSYIPQPERKLYFEKAILCCREVLLYENKFLESYIAFIKSKEEHDKEVKSFSKKIRHMPAKESKEVVEICYSLLLRTIILKYPDEYEKIFRFFMSLCPALGIVVNRMFSIELNPIENWDIDNSFKIVTNLLDILDDSKIPLTFQLDEITLQNWFTSMVIGLSNINTKNFSESFLKMVKRVYDFNPLVIEPSCKVISMIMLQIKIPTVKTAYVQLIQSVLQGSTKIQRLQKFIAFFMENMRDYLRTSFCEDNLLLEDVLPLEVYNDFTSAFSALPFMQILAMLRSFTFHLKRDCLNALESSSDNVLVINFSVICELLAIFLLSANIIDYSVPENVKSKYKLLLEDLQALMQLMGNIFQHVHEDRLLKPFFKLCKAYGEVKLLFREYDNIEIVPPMDIDYEPTNISYVHNYLDPDCWGRIAQSVESHVHCQAANLFYELLIQKIGAISQVEEGSEGPGTQVARYLLSHADNEWLFEKVLTLAPLFQSAELSKLISKIVRHLGDDQSVWFPFLKEEAFTENRPLVLGLAFCLMYRASKKCGSEEDEEGRESISKLVLSLVSLKELLDYELSQLIVDDEELREMFEAACGEMAAILNENLPLFHTPLQNSSHISLFEIPARLPLHYMSAVSQSCTLMSATALLYDLPSGSEADMLLFNLLLKIMDGPQKNNACLLSDLNLESFLKFVATRGKDYRGQRKLMKRICMCAFRTKKSAKQLFREVEHPSISDVWITALVIDCLVQLKKKFIGSKETKKPLERKKCLDYLMNSVLPVICSEPASSSLLYSFTIVFNHTLRYISSYREHFDKLVLLLDEYINFALADYTEGERLVECVVEHRNELGEHFPPSLILATFQEMKIQLIRPSDSTSHMLFGSATSAEFKVILNKILEETKLDALEVEGFKSERLLLLWAQILSCLLNSDKCHDRNEALVILLEQFVLVTKPWANGSAQHLVEPLMTIVITLSRNSGIELRGPIIDSILEICGAVPLLTDNEVTLTNLDSLLNALLSLYRHRMEVLTDRLPAFLQRYRHCLNSLPVVVNKSSEYSLIKRAVPVSNKMERLATSMIKRPKDFSRLAPYLIADIITIFQSYDIPEDIKFAYDNVVNAFLSISDKHAISYLKGILPTSQQELFNEVYENFNKFHRFVGKI